MLAARLEKLNPQQRRAVEHGGVPLGDCGPLLIIAGAGSGKTSTLAHRVVYLIENGADPRRIMLLTFSRRAAAEMTRRVDRILADPMCGRGAAMADAMAWAGTFHAIGARLLRHYADDIGIAGAFTIHDREDSGDLMNLVRHDLGLSKTKERFPPASAAEHWPSFVEAVRLVRSGAAGWPAELDLVRHWYEPHLQRVHEDAMLRQADLLQLVQIASTYPTRERFLTELTLDPPDATSDRSGEPLLDEDYLILSTIHSAKGQEWKSVYILNVVDGCLPSDLAIGTSAEIEEERRLLYVAMTRARDHLDVIVPQRFFVHGQRSNGDRHMYAARTRFIPAGLLEHFESCIWPPATVAQAAPRSARVPVDIRKRVRGRWG